MKAALCFFVLANIIAGALSSSLIDLDSLDSSTLFKLTMNSTTHIFGSSLHSAGDVNGDGIDDFIVSGTELYVIYGTTGGIPQDIDLLNLDLSKGFSISGGFMAIGNSAGDVNGDGVDDVIIGVASMGPDPGVAYIIYGRAGGVQSRVDLKNLPSSQGVKIIGDVGVGNAGGYFGVAVSSAGDINGDGVGDVIIGAPGATVFERYSAGIAYIIYGREGGFTSTINLATGLDSSQGFKISGAAAHDALGTSVSCAGDVNGDGVDDIIVGAGKAQPSNQVDAGTSYIIYGKIQCQGNIDLATALQSSQGFKISGSKNDFLGILVNSAGDVNGDGITDVMISSSNADLFGRRETGAVTIIYGKVGSQSDIDLRTGLSLTRGFQIIGGLGGGNLGGSFSSIGDMNGDGAGDLIIGCTNYGHYGATTAINAYVIYGRIGGLEAHIDLDHSLSVSQGINITGGYNAFASSLVASGDVNNDGLKDILIGAAGNRSVYIIYSGCNIPNCFQCTSSQKCQACQSNFMLNDGKCYDPSHPIPGPCPSGYYRDQNDICVSECPAGFIQRIQDNRLFCDQNNSNNPQPPTHTTANITLQIYIRYNISLINFNSQDGLNKFIQVLATILGIDSSYISIIDVREGSTIIESAVSAGSSSDSASIDATVTKIQAMSQKLSAAVNNNNINIIDGVDILDYKPSIQIALPSGSNYGQVQDSGLSKGIIIGLAVALGVVALMVVGYCIYRNVKAKKLMNVRNEPRSEKRTVNNIEVDIRQANHQINGETIKHEKEGDISEEAQTLKGINLERNEQISPPRNKNNCQVLQYAPKLADIIDDYPKLQNMDNK